METEASASADLRDAYRRARLSRIELARRDAATFSEYVLRDERDGGAITLAPMHARWHQLIDRHDRLVILAHVEAGKTANISVGRVLFELARDPSKRICILSNTWAQARRIVATVGQYIEHSEELHEVAPHLRPGPIWREDALVVERPTVAKDASVTGFGLHGSIVGSRFDLVVVDDLEDYESTRTEAQRKQTHDWLIASAFTRLTANGRIIAIGTCWQRDDVLAMLSRRADFATYRFPVVDPETGEPNWPARWPLERIERVRQQLGPFDSARSLDLVPLSDEDCVFKREWIAGALERGAHHGVTQAAYLLEKHRLAVGVDLGISQKATADLTALVAAVQMPNGDRRVLACEAGRWSIDQILERIANHARRYVGAEVVVESVAAQQYVADLARKTYGVRVVPFKTGGGKMSLQFQAEKLAHELSQGKWRIPTHDGLAPEMRALVADLQRYNPADHVGDRLAALLLARHGLDRPVAEHFRLDLQSR